MMIHYKQQENGLTKLKKVTGTVYIIKNINVMDTYSYSNIDAPLCPRAELRVQEPEPVRPRFEM
jgi:hypothetical protein